MSKAGREEGDKTIAECKEFMRQAFEKLNIQIENVKSYIKL